jgi:hypothetical protein
LPHFLNGDKKLLNSVIGLSPDLNEHDFILSVDPITGSTIQAKKRFQINYYLKKNQNIK